MTHTKERKRVCLTTNSISRCICIELQGDAGLWSKNSGASTGYKGRLMANEATLMVILSTTYSSNWKRSEQADQYILHLRSHVANRDCKYYPYTQEKRTTQSLW